MIRELKIFELKCDGCGTLRSDFARDEQTAMIKLAWSYHEVHGCGSMGYTRYDHLCPKCAGPGDRRAQ